MNLLYYLRQFPSLSQSFVLNEIYELKNRGHNVAVFALKNPAENITHQEYEELNIPVHYADNPSYTDVLDLLSLKIINPDVLQNVVFEASPKQHAIVLDRTKQCIEFVEENELDIDLVHTHFAALSNFAAQYVASYHNVPFTVTAHAADLYKYPNNNRLKYIVSNADQVVTISEYNKKHIQNKITDETSISVVHAGIRPEKFEPSPFTANMRILTVSRFVEKKGLPYAIQAVGKVIDEFPSLEYHIIGSGPMENEIRKRINKCGLTDAVELLGTVSDDQLIDEFDQASCFLLPCVVAESGDRDGIPVALMEAMAMKTAPISTSVSGIPELIDHQQNGLIVEPNNTDELAEAIKSLLSDPVKRRRFCEEGRKKIEKEFNIKKEAAKLDSVFTRVINRG